MNRDYLEELGFRNYSKYLGEHAAKSLDKYLNNRDIYVGLIQVVVFSSYYYYYLVVINGEKMLLKLSLTYYGSDGIGHTETYAKREYAPIEPHSIDYDLFYTLTYADAFNDYININEEDVKKVCLKLTELISSIYNRKKSARK